MKKGPNMHTIDRAVRLIVGVVCAYIGFIDSSLITSRPAAIAVGIFGVVNIWAFITTRCPVYSVAGFSTAAKQQDTADNGETHEA